MQTDLEVGLCSYSYYYYYYYFYYYYYYYYSLCGCPVLLRTKYYARHNAVMCVIYSKLLVMYGFETELKPWLRDDYVEKIKENEFCKLFWDFEFQTDSFVKYNKLDIAVMEKIRKHILIIEGSIPADMNLVERTANKLNYYYYYYYYYFYYYCYYY